VTRLARPGLCVINTHLAANRDGDWSPASRFYSLHRAQLAVLARIVSSAVAPAVVCGDFNVAGDSSLFGGFVTGASLADAFGGSCPPTFRTEHLPPGATPHCIDFILTADGVRAEAATVVFAGQQPLPGGAGYVSDHIGLRAALIVAPPLTDGQDLVHDPV
jgi:endonuclease/exonuclease/phosphatase family metal-dependent hydrolase